MRGLSAFTRIFIVLFVAVFLTSCSGVKLPFMGGKEPDNKLEGLVPIASSGLSTTKDIRADVVDLLMDSSDVKVLKEHISKLALGQEENWTNDDTGNSFTVRAIESMPSNEEGGSRKIVVWGKRKGAARTIAKTYRYYF